MRQRGFIQLGLVGYAFVGCAAVIAAMGAAVWIQTSRLDDCTEKYAAFRAEVKASGEAARAEAKRRELQDFLRKERSDAAYMAEIDALRARLGRLRNAGGAASGRLPAAPSGSKSPEGQACFDRAELQRAYGKLVEELRAIAAEGSEVEAALKTAREWANGDKGIPGAP